MKAKFNFLPLAFFTSAAQYDQCPDGQFKEIAFVGASNAGKSSAINALSNNNKLAKISKTPGKTKLFNFFKCGKGYIVDFPGVLLIFASFLLLERALIAEDLPAFDAPTKAISLNCPSGH